MKNARCKDLSTLLNLKLGRLSFLGYNYLVVAHPLVNAVHATIKD